MTAADELRVLARSLYSSEHYEAADRIEKWIERYVKTVAVTFSGEPFERAGARVDPLEHRRKAALMALGMEASKAAVIELEPSLSTEFPEEVYRATLTVLRAE